MMKPWSRSLPKKDGFYWCRQHGGTPTVCWYSKKRNSFCTCSICNERDLDAEYRTTQDVEFRRGAITAARPDLELVRKLADALLTVYVNDKPFDVGDRLEIRKSGAAVGYDRETERVLGGRNRQAIEKLITEILTDE